ncbi:3-hydroxyacyl-CoA dehydrogenase NAD-binding domain-containing protein [Hymenobacter sp. BT770]|uniref:3-hydroxyacyl-CoA dehydrogenase/enoyl-CoA hydratase family protein n=1 Tax=Hymenobacter sp. BT770 TaxID=2886942 RepID=UPI001D10B317|nr:3-hydroxyacyl-CoA dehydrogenase/enoyl-CoA hydratase family protein [Hymenobacter sp. BT770]MCC3155029.1 enoyl-CoA hydratase/isomerase family protein [Hymenobacter sp. BT770]MDO3416953.1 3-hydroxyacyl-CoA dehydrogenase NAD-binding domain-containing protein [Hymenobacter sp. BT770]
MNRTIKKVAVLGSGVMGSRIACHFANIGVQVLLLDIAPKELLPDEEKKGLQLDAPAVKNRLVNAALQAAIASNPSPLYRKADASRIKTGNFDDNLKDIASCDWTIEVVVERLDIKKSLFERVEQFRKPGTLITSNTSGIPIHLMTEGRSDDFKKHFCGTHFFNPPRYLKLLEIIPTPDTDPAIVDFLLHYGDLYLGKTTVLAKDTPAFIANRVGVFAIMDVLRIMQELGLTVEEVDKLTGPVIGHAKSATFRTSDIVGLDTLMNVANGLAQGLPNDEAKDVFQLPDFLKKMGENKWLGDKTGQGFYKKVKGEGGKSEIQALDLNTLEYQPGSKVKFATLELTKTMDTLAPRFAVLVSGKDKAGEFYRKSFGSLFAYVSNRIPEITDALYKIDDALRAGFGWEMGPFETWDALGVQKGIELMQAEGKQPAAWVTEMLAAGHTTFYKVNAAGSKEYYDAETKSYQPIRGVENFIILDNLRTTGKVLWKNAGASIIDLGDGILNVEFHSKMNSLGQDVIQGLLKGVDMAEAGYRGLVVGNDAPQFSAGANLGLVYMQALEQEFEELNMMIAQFQNAMMRMRYSSIPVVGAPHGLALGGGCELNLHCDRVVAAAETYMGLVEFGVGLIPAGGGTKEMTLRTAAKYEEGEPEFNLLRNTYMTISTAKVSTSAAEAFDLGFMRRGDEIVVNSNRVIAAAKAAALDLADAGYTQPTQKTNIKVHGKGALAMFKTGVYAMQQGNYISTHDQLIADKLAYVMCGGDLSSPTEVSEQYLLDLEREAFLSLCGERKTLERIQSILTTGKPLRN